MSPVSIIPANHDEWLALRAKDITSTEAAALFGMSPYLTPFELYHRKRSAIVGGFTDNQRMAWGRRLQDSIASGVAEERDWIIAPMPEYIRDETARLGASFDFRVRAVRPGSSPPAPEGILEVKNVDGLVFRDQWIADDGQMEAPVHIELQLQHQLEVSQLGWGAIAVLVGGNALHVIERKRDQAVGAAIRQRAVEFWQRVDSGNAPDPDFRADAKLIAKAYGYADPNRLMDARGDTHIAKLGARYLELSAVAKNAQEERDAVKAELLTLIGDAEKTLGDGFSISAGVVIGGRVEYDRPTYRNFRITAKKGSK